MQGESKAIQWLEELGTGSAVDLMPLLPRPQMAEAYRRAQVMLSVTSHDGTPNTLLEGMACGCFPVCGDLESIREWIEPGENGSLVDPNDPHALAEAVVQSVNNPGLRESAREINLKLIAQKAEHTRVMHSAEAFYQKLI
jgi:glycosyltransferase involved in cell wall biosynthesis